MKNKVALGKIADIAEMPEKVLEIYVRENESLAEDEDYFMSGNHMYIYLPTALSIIGRFSLQDKVLELTPVIIELSHEARGTFTANSPDLPQLNSTEQNWNDKIVPMIHANAEVCALSYPAFLRLIYTRMDVNFPALIGEYLERVGCPTGTASKFRVITVNKELRALFEDTMAQIMKENAAKRMDKRKRA